jgi:hypothetical protein
MSIGKTKRILVLGILAGVLFAVRAEAVPIVSITPVSQTVNVGDPVSVDILVSGLGALEAVGGFSLILSFNSAILSGVGFAIDPDSKMGVEDSSLSGGFAGGTLDLFVFAEDFAPAGPGPEEFTNLKALQGAGFRLATINFSAIGAGLSPLTLSVAAPGGTFLSDALGNNLTATGENGSVCVAPAAGVPANCDVAAVPEPGTIALFGTGVAALLVRRRRQVRSRA